MADIKRSRKAEYDRKRRANLREQLKANAAQYYAENRDRIVAQRHAIRSQNPEKLRERSRNNYYKNLDENRKCNNERMKRKISDPQYRASNKYKARMLVKYAVKMGYIIKPDCCEMCGGQIPKRSLHGHHYLGHEPNVACLVKWLCARCHGKIED